MSAYTGPVQLFFFQGVRPDDKFALTVHKNAEDPRGLGNILLRLKEDGYKHVKTVDRFMVNGSLVHPDERSWRPALGFRTRSAFLR